MDSLTFYILAVLYLVLPQSWFEKSISDSKNMIFEAECGLRELAFTASGNRDAESSNLHSTLDLMSVTYRHNQLPFYDPIDCILSSLPFLAYFSPKDL